MHSNKNSHTYYVHITAMQGRNGLGSIYVWASGDGGPNDDCNCDGYAASMWTISINSATNDGQTASYDESCSSTLASTFSNGKSGNQDAGVVSMYVLYHRRTRKHTCLPADIHARIHTKIH